MAGHIKRMGNQMVVNINGDQLLAYPTQGEVWIISGSGDWGPDPEPPDPTDETFDWPFPVTCVSSEYGPRNGRVHQGIDLASNGTGEAYPGAPIPAANDGTIYRSNYHNNFGNHVIIDHGMRGNVRLFTLYAHMVSPSSFSQGDTINKGDILGNVGNTGASEGAHLHWETHVTGGGGPTWTNPGTHQNPRNFMVVYG